MGRVSRIGASVALMLAAGWFPVRGQDQNSTGTSPTDGVQIDKRIFGVLPNYRSADGSLPYAPITVRQKWGIGLRDSFDKPVYLLAGFYASISQMTGSNPSLGGGMKGFGNRYIRSLGDASIGNVLTEAVFPTLLREDPRYFLQTANGGTFRHRAWYAVTRIVVTRTDSGGRRFNVSEFAGNATAVAISNAYYPGNWNTRDSMTKLGIQVGTDALANVLKEFWPDVKTRLFHKKTLSETD